MSEIYIRGGRTYRFFPTGSQFNGHMSDNLHAMDGFGVYTYPNEGSQYRGFFKDGKFHGFGCMKIMGPQKMEIHGHFENGVIVRINEMIFADGLSVQCSVHNKRMKFHNWVYCTNEERRYSTELTIGLQAVGPDSFLTRSRAERDLAEHCYDTEEGIYNTQTGFISHIPKPFSHSRFVACKSEIDWITRHCRKGPTKDPSGNTPAPTEPSAEFRRLIISNNLKQSKKTQIGCECNFHHHYSTIKKCATTDSESNVVMTPTVRSCSSFYENSIIEDVNIECESLKLDDDTVSLSDLNLKLVRQRISMVVNK